MPAKLFISYSTVDLDAATRAKNVLQAAGHTAYVAEYSAHGGVRLPDDIKKNIAACDFFVVVWSSNAKKSSWVDQEIGFAESLSKMIIPVVLERELKPSGFLSDRKYVRAYEDFGKAVAELKEIVEVESKRRSEETTKAIAALAALGLLVAALSSK